MMTPLEFFPSLSFSYLHARSFGVALLPLKQEEKNRGPYSLKKMSWISFEVFLSPKSRTCYRYSIFCLLKNQKIFRQLSPGDQNLHLRDRPISTCLSHKKQQDPSLKKLYQTGLQKKALRNLLSPFFLTMGQTKRTLLPKMTVLFELFPYVLENDTNIQVNNVLVHDPN